MYISRIIFAVKPGSEDAFRATAVNVAELARHMPGCVYFDLFTLASDTSEYMLYEEWESDEQAAVFKASRERNYAVAKLAPTMAAAPVVNEFSAEPLRR